MRRRPIAVVTVLAALAVPLAGCAAPVEYRATVSNSGHTWSMGSWCDDPTGDGGRVDITRVIVQRTGSSVEVKFTIRRLPKPEQKASAAITFHDKAGIRAGILSTTWKGYGLNGSVTTVKPASSRTSPVAVTPILDRVARTITTTYPSGLYDSVAAGWVWKASTTLDGKRQDSCTNNPRAFRAGKAHATGGNR